MGKFIPKTHFPMSRLRSLFCLFFGGRFTHFLLYWLHDIFLCVLYNFAFISLRRRELAAVFFIIFLLECLCHFLVCVQVYLLRGALDYYVIFDCVFSWLYWLLWDLGLTVRFMLLRHSVVCRTVESFSLFCLPFIL